ncbi:MAG TPA: MBL fold metallo-hydrolase [Verrucomicrobiae bacterium]|nr:MBL fold metallo-hydrolase [Verrucomicrobiae bacterium]
MRVCLLASGSKGNAIYVESGNTRLLVDAGLAAREIDRRLAAIGVEGTSLDAVLVTHEHSDHVRGAGAVARRYRIPVMLSHGTARPARTMLGKVEAREFESSQPFTFRDLRIDPFPITHDAADPVGFIIDSAEGRVGVATDLGIATRLVQDKLASCRILVLEFNHDEEMLVNGPYPWHLKQRIRSRHGHLSNGESALLLEDILHGGLEAVFLAHLSEVNNHPEIALKAAASTVSRQNVCGARVIVGNQYQPSAAFAAC